MSPMFLSLLLDSRARSRFIRCTILQPPFSHVSSGRNQKEKRRWQSSMQRRKQSCPPNIPRAINGHLLAQTRSDLFALQLVSHSPTCTAFLRADIRAKRVVIKCVCHGRLDCKPSRARLKRNPRDRAETCPPPPPSLRPFLSGV